MKGTAVYSPSLECATHFAPTGCRGSNSNAYFAYTIPCGSHAVKKSVLYRLPTSLVSIQRLRKGGRLWFAWAGNRELRYLRNKWDYQYLCNLATIRFLTILNNYEFVWQYRTWLHFSLLGNRTNTNCMAFPARKSNQDVVLVELFTSDSPIFFKKTEWAAHHLPLRVG